MRLKLGLISSICALAALAVTATIAGADPHSGPPICNGTETAISGHYDNLTITGNRYVPARRTLAVTGNLRVAPGACLDAYTTGTVTVGRDLLVGKAAILGLGCAPFEDAELAPCGHTTTHDTVGRNLFANQPYTMYLSADTIHGNLVSIGGGPGITLKPYVNFPIKDSVIGGNVVVTGWQGAWFGFLRNTVSRNAVFTGILTANPDSNEIVTNSIARNLVCLQNRPTAQVGDSKGSPNKVGRNKIGECP
jgi:hypothetical protein